MCNYGTPYTENMLSVIRIYLISAVQGNLENPENKMYRILYLCSE